MNVQVEQKSESIDSDCFCWKARFKPNSSTLRTSNKSQRKNLQLIDQKDLLES